MAAIAPWFHLRLQSCGPTFESQAHHLHFFQFVLKLEWEKNENKQKEAGIGPFLKKYGRTSNDLAGTQRVPGMASGNWFPLSWYHHDNFLSPLPPYCLLLGSPQLVDPHPSQQLQQVCTRSKASFEPNLPKKYAMDGGAIRWQHILVSCFTRPINTSMYLLSYYIDHANR